MTFKPQEPALKQKQSSPLATEHQKAPPHTRGFAWVGINLLQDSGICFLSTPLGRCDSEELSEPSCKGHRASLSE